MPQGDYIFVEWRSAQRLSVEYQSKLKMKEMEIVNLLESKWSPRKFSWGLTPKQSGEFGRTTIMPELFHDHLAADMVTWRQKFQTTGHMTIISGRGSGNTLAEDWAVLWTGLALPNKNQHLTEIKMQIGDRKYGRINLEEMHQYQIPVIIFEEPFIIDEETAFDLYGYIEGELPDNGPGGEADTLFQRIVMTGCAFYKQIDRALGTVGAVM